VNKANNPEGWVAIAMHLRGSGKSSFINNAIKHMKLQKQINAEKNYLNLRHNKY
jgi:hypothetical protein